MKREMASVITALALSLFGVHCDDGLEALVNPGPAGLLSKSAARVYNYAAYDSSETEIVRGTLVLALDSSNHASGFWVLEQTDSEATMIGPQVGEGTLVGGMDGPEIWMNLNPEMADNNVFLRGVFSGDDINGQWEFVGFPGVLNQGTFQAVGVND